MDEITTYTGKRIDPMNPDSSAIDIKDIAHALSLICRGGGHSRFFFSVAQHSINCAKEGVERGFDRDDVMMILLHDASEAYMSDLVRPIKRRMPSYSEAEEKLQNLIWTTLVGKVPDSEERKRIKLVDDLMFSLEFHEYMAREANRDYRKVVSGVRCKKEDPEDVEREFLKIYRLLKKMETGETVKHSY